ncbi:lanthionine synthetase-like protein [Chitinophaga skermanii]|uniref:Lanthionine synthetase-like protein n=1 Tax=Chitinophaga skermanii TaxID=331697 RepID=A0A327R501_9BACT|nr:lanthionine synthetase LanC family protein [Chitinophaga skermanii]RAJ11168.1 lanthionine synthetase-like protein [Chitinophaga skermanii]
MLKAQIDKINSFITEEYDKNCQIMSGVLSDALYFFYYGIVYQDQSAKDRAYRNFAYHTDTVNEHMMNYKFAHGLTGMAWFSQFLVNNNLLPADYTEDFNDIDEAIIHTMSWDAEDQVYDHTIGTIGKCIYLMERGTNQHYKTLSEAVLTLRRTAHFSDDGKACCWLDLYTSHFNEAPRKRVNYYNHGLAHGLSSIVFFLCKCYKQDIEKETCEQLIVASLNWLRQHKNEQQFPYIYPNIVYRDGEVNTSFTQGWCMGLISNAAPFYFAGKTLGNEEWINNFREAIQISQHITLTKNNFPSLEITGGHAMELHMCHGMSSFIYQYDKIYNETGWQECKDMGDYWANHLTSYLTDDVLINFPKHGILRGLPGLALPLLNRENGSKVNFAWDKILLFDIENL